MSNGVSNLQQRHLHMYPVILTSSCRQRGRLFAQERNLSKHRNVTRSKGVWNHPPPPYCGEEQAEGRPKFSIGTEKMFDQEIPFDPVVNMLYTMGFRSQGNGPREKSTRNLYCRIFSLRHYDRREPRRSCRCRGSQGSETETENFIKKRLKEVKYRTVEETWHVPLSEKESLIKKLLNMQNCLKKRRRPLKSTKRRSLTRENHQLPKNPNNAAKRNF